MATEFQYNNEWYKYEDGRIAKKNSFISFEPFCPVLSDLHEHLLNFTDEQLQAVLKAITHGYSWGRKDGESAKIREIKRVLKID